MCVVHAARRARCADGEVGEIWVRSASIASGFWRRDGGDADDDGAFGATLADDVDGKRGGAFLRTGDEGFARDGELFVTGRSKDLIVVGGRNFAPEDIERTIRDADASEGWGDGTGASRARGALRPGSIAAFSIERDGSTTDESIGVIAETRDDAISASLAGVVVDGVRAVISQTHGVSVRREDVLLLRARTAPRTTSGKLRRRACAEAFRDGTLSVVDAMKTNRRASTGDDDADVNRRRRRHRPFPDGRAPLLRTYASRGRDAVVAEMEAALLDHVRRRHGRSAGPGRRVHANTRLNREGVMDSFAIATMHGELELDLAIALPPTLLLVEGSTPRTLARALCDLAVAPDAPGGDPGEDETPTVAGEDETPTVATLPGSMRAPSRPLVVCAVLVAVAVATTPAPWAMFTSSALSSRAFGEERMRGLWGLGRRRVDRAAHWRLLEWSRTVAPFQVAAAVVIATVRVVAARVCKVPPKTTAFWCALAHAALAHGVPGAAFVLAPTCAVFFAGRAFDRPRDRKRATWVAGACLLLACNLTEPSASAASASASKRARRRGGWWLELASVGFLGRASCSFDHRKAARFSLIRMISHGLETSGDAAGVTFERFAACVSYVMYPPLYQCGPFVSFATFAKSPATRGASGPSGAFYTLVPIRPRRRGERRSLRTLPGASLRPGSLGFNPRPRRLSTPTDAFQLHPDIRSYRTTLIASDDGRATTTRKARRRASRSAPTTPRVPRAYLRLVRRRGGVHAARVLPLRGVPRREGVRGRRRDRGGVDAEVCSIHWSPYDSVRVVNADP